MIAIKKYADMLNDPIFRRESYSYGVEDTVKAILADVKQRGDAAVFAYTKKFDRADLQALAVSPAERLKFAGLFTPPSFWGAM